MPIRQYRSPPSVGPILGPTTVCKGKSGVVFSVPYQPGVTYNWSYSGSGVNIVSGQGTHSITANFSMTASPGVLSVTVSNASCSALSSKNIDILIPSWELFILLCTYDASCAGYPLPPPSYPCTGDVEGNTAPYAHCNSTDTIHCIGEWECMCSP